MRRMYPDECPAFEINSMYSPYTGGTLLRMNRVYEGSLDADGDLRMTVWSDLVQAPLYPLVNPAWVRPLTPAAEAMLALVK